MGDSGCGQDPGKVKREDMESMDIADEVYQMAAATRKSKNSEGEWLSTNETVEVVSDFEMFSEQVRRVTADPHRWKWTIIALHSGIQGMMVLALRGSNGLNVLREKDKQKWQDWYYGGQSDELRPRYLKLASFLTLYERIKGDKILLYTGSRKFVPRGTQGRSIKDLNKLRNEFIHFTPRVWTFELDGLPAIVSDCLEIAEFLAWESDNIVFAELDLRERLKSAFKSARSSLATNIIQVHAAGFS